MHTQGCAADGAQRCETGAHEAHGEHKVQGARRVAFVMGAGKGSGLGLSIALEIVQRHHGKLELMPHEGPGTTIRMTLPITQDQAVQS